MRQTIVSELNNIRGDKNEAEYSAYTDTACGTCGHLYLQPHTSSHIRTAERYFCESGDNTMTIYIKPVKKASAKGSVKIGDIAEIVAPKDIEKRVKALKIAEVTEDKSNLVSVTDIIAKISAAFPNFDISNVGETDTVIEYDSPKKHEGGIKLFIKTALVTLMLASGSATAIMSFHSDAQMSRVFETYYRIFFGSRSINPAVIHLPYSIGLAVGIIVFFNHFTGKKLTSDPTPIEVEMSTYESDVTDNIIDTLNAQRKNGGNN